MLENTSGIQIAFFIISLLIAMSFHEAMHAFTGHSLGDDTAQREGRLTLNPLAHIDLYTTILLPIVMVLLHLPPILAAKPVPFNPNRVKGGEFGAAVVGIAGPFTNLALACVSALFFRLLPSMSVNLADFLVIFTAVNTGLFIFNMIPFPPLDGSRVLYAFAPEPLQNLMRTIEQFGFISILLFFFVLYQFVGPVVSRLNFNLLQILLGVSF